MNSNLNGKRIVNTRAVHQAEALNTRLQTCGAISVMYPCIAIIPPDDHTALDQALSDLSRGQFDWLVLTSTNTVYALAQRLTTLNLTFADSLFHTAAVGASTAESAAQVLGLKVDVLPAEYIAESLANTLPIVSGLRVLLPESALARPILADLLTARGAQVTVITAYQTVCGAGGVNMPEMLSLQHIDALTFTSSSTVTYFLERLTNEGGRCEDALQLCAACIGPKTAVTARECGFSKIIITSEHTLDGLVNALDEFFNQEMFIGKQQ